MLSETFQGDTKKTPKKKQRLHWNYPPPRMQSSTPGLFYLWATRNPETKTFICDWHPGSGGGIDSRPKWYLFLTCWIPCDVWVLECRNFPSNKFVKMKGLAWMIGRVVMGVCLFPKYPIFPLKTGYFEDPTPSIQVQTLPSESPSWSFELHNFCPNLKPFRFRSIQRIVTKNCV